MRREQKVGIPARFAAAKSKDVFTVCAESVLIISGASETNLASVFVRRMLKYALPLLQTFN